MSEAIARQPRREDPDPARSGAAVLAERIAAALVHHEPGWRLPRQSALARRYNASPAEVDAAIGDLAARNLLRRLPDGQVYRASPAHYLLTLEGLPGLAARIDPMGASITCAARRVSLRRAPEDIGQVLGLPPGGQVTVIKCTWASGGQHAAVSATYLPGQAGLQLPSGEDFPPDAMLELPPEAAASGIPGPAGRPAAALVEMQPPAPSVARSLQLAPGQPAVSVTIKFSRSAAARTLAITVAFLRCEFFKIVIEAAPAPGLTGGVSSGWPRPETGSAP